MLKENYTEINTQLSNIDQESKLAQGDIDVLWKRFADELSITYEYERSIAINMKEDSKIVWKFIQSKTKTKENIPCIIDEKGERNTNDN